MDFSFDSLERRYESLNRIQLNSNQINKAIGFLILAIFVVIIGGAIMVNNFEVDFLSEAIIATVFIIFLVVIFLQNYSDKYIMKKQDLRFYRLFDAYIKLKNFRSTKTDDDQNKAIKSVNLLSTEIESWVKNAPKEILALPQSVSENLKTKLNPSIKQKKFEIVSNFENRLMNVLIGMGEEDVKIDHLESMDNTLETIKIEGETKKVPGVPISSKIGKHRFYLIIGASIPVFIFSQFIQELDLGERIDRILFFALALGAILFAVKSRYKRFIPPTNTTKSRKI